LIADDIKIKEKLGERLGCRMGLRRRRGGYLMCERILSREWVNLVV
jgi:hypothetical protein